MRPSVLHRPMFPLPLASWELSPLSGLGVGGPHLTGSMGTVSSLSMTSLFRVDSLCPDTYPTHWCIISISVYLINFIDLTRERLSKKLKNEKPPCLDSENARAAIPGLLSPWLHSERLARQPGAGSGWDVADERRGAFPGSCGHRGVRKQHKVYSITNL